MRIVFTATFNRHHPLYGIKDFKDEMGFLDWNAAIRWANQVNKNPRADYHVTDVASVEGDKGYKPILK